jgi:hypothetical protein
MRSTRARSMMEKYFPLFMCRRMSRSVNQQRKGVRHGPSTETGPRALDRSRVNISLKMRFMQIGAGWSEGSAQVFDTRDRDR